MTSPAAPKTAQTCATVQADLTQGVTEFHQQQAEKAIFLFSRAVATDPACVRAHTNLAYVMNTEGRFSEAEDVARKAIEMRRMDLKARFVLGFSLASQKKNFEEAMLNLEMASEEFPEARLEMTRFLVERGEFERAIKELDTFKEQAKLAKKTGAIVTPLLAR